MALVQPKRVAGGAYGLFVQENRAAFAEKVKGQAATAVCKLGGEAWKKLSEAERAPYDKKYAAAKVTFETDMAAFLAAGGVKQKGPQALRSAKRKAKELEKKNNTDASNAPKRPAGAAYGIWLNQKRASIVESLPAGHRKMDLAKAAAEMWKALPAAEKKPFEEEYRKTKVAYRAALKEYRRTGGRMASESDDDDEPPAKEGKTEKDGDEGGRVRQPPAKEGKTKKARQPPAKEGKTEKVDDEGGRVRQPAAKEGKTKKARQPPAKEGKTEKDDDEGGRVRQPPAKEGKTKKARQPPAKEGKTTSA